MSVSKVTISKVTQFAVTWLLYGLVYTLLEYGLLGNSKTYPATGNPYNFKQSLIINSIATLIMGILHGILEISTFKRLFRQYTVWLQLIIKTLIYLSIIILFILGLNTIMNSSLLGKSIFSTEIWRANIQFITSFSFISIIIFVFSVVISSLFVSEIVDYSGQNVLVNFFTGKYHKPRNEKRIFMFLDMKSSTTIAEKIGHEKFHALLKRYYEDMTISIENNGGNIYQYAGDSALITWMYDATACNQSIQMFYDFKNLLQKNSDYYINHFGILPECKAGLQGGNVSVGIIGVMKKEIVFSGDVLNTAARVQSLCNDYNSDLLMTESFRNTITDTKCTFSDLGYLELKGKGERVKVFSCTMVGSA